MTGVLIAACAAGIAVGLALPARGVVTAPPHDHSPREARQRPTAVRAAIAALAAAAVPLMLDGVLAILGALAVAVLAWRVLAAHEPAEVAAARREAERDLPHLVLLLGAGLRAGSAPPQALARAGAALPGAAADRLRPALARLSVGVAPVEVWREVARDPVLAPLGTALGRSAESGAPVARAVERLAADLAADARSGIEDRARSVGARAALPLGLCLLPAFLLLGIVPLVAALMGGLLPG